MNHTQEVTLLTVDGVILEGTLRCLAWHVDHGAPWTSGDHTPSHDLTVETNICLALLTHTHTHSYIIPTFHFTVPERHALLLSHSRWIACRWKKKDVWHKAVSYFFPYSAVFNRTLLVKFSRRDLQKRLKAGTGSVVDQKINGSDPPQCCLDSFPVRQVYAQGGDGRTLATNAPWDLEKNRFKLVKMTYVF